MTVLPIAPSSKFVAVTKSDTVPVKSGTAIGDPLSTKGLYIGGAGDLAVKNDAGVVVTFENIPAGSLLPLNVQYVMAATTATNIIALF